MKKIGVLGNFFRPERAGSPSPFGAYYVNRDYHDAFLRLGVLPITVPYLDNEQAAGISSAYNAADCCAAFLDLLDGLVLTGGFDIPPCFFNQPELSGAQFTYDRRRVIFELELLKQAEKRRIPIFGICLGLQLYNVFRGGTIIQDIGIQRADSLDHRKSNQNPEIIAHRVFLRSGSVLSGWCQSDSLAVNSSHHQAVDRPGEGLIINAESEDGIIEGLESEDGLFVGVQWHPESLQYSMKEHHLLFAEFVRSL